MGLRTKIEWCDSTVNPVMGCAGCELWHGGRQTCYAGQLHRRWPGHRGFAPEFLRPKLFPGRTAQAAGWSDLTGLARPDKPWLDGRPRLIFLSDMGDALSERGAIDDEDRPVPGDGVPFEFLKAEVVDVALSPRGQRHCWLWLTKRPQRLLSFWRWLNDEYGLTLPRNIWIGTSVTTQATLSRVAHLAEVGGDDTVRFVSVEPLWEEVSLAEHLGRVAWVIAGGESSQGSTPKEFKCEWARKLRDECARAGVPFFSKQLGAHVTDGGTPLRLRDSHGGDWSEWPADLRVREMPSIRAGADPVGIAAPQPTRAPVPLPVLPAGEQAPPARQDDRPFVLLADIQPQPVEWLWANRIPLGELTVLDGDPATNKSSLLLDLAARVSTGRAMPDGAGCGRGGVLLLAAEDSINKTLPLRLRAAGADLARIAALTKDVSLPEGLPVVEEAARRVGARVVVIDPLMAFLGPHACGDQSVRRALTPLKALAERANIAVVLVRHLTKGGGRHPLYRGGGSIGIIGATRSALLVARDPDDPSLRVLAHVKSNLGPLARSLIFEPVPAEGGVVRVEWRGECGYTAQDLLTPPRGDGGRLHEATAFLADILAGGPVEQAAVRHQAVANAIAYRTVERAKQLLGVVSHRRGWGPGSVISWELPAEDRPPG